MKVKNDKTNTPGEYPPRDHILRDLLISLELQVKGQSVIRVPVVPEVCADGAVQVGVLATMVDFLGGFLSVSTVYPDWTATADMSIFTTGRAVKGTVALTGSVMRAGRTAVVIGVDIHEEAGNPSDQTTSIGSAIMTFSRLPRREENPEVDINDDNKTVTVNLAIEGSGLTGSYLDEIGALVLDEAAGVVELNMSDYVRNSLGSLQGGMFAILSDVAGQNAARAATGKPMITSDLVINYLSQGKVGPFRTKSRVLRTTHDTALTRIEVFDRGADDRLTTVVMNTATLDKKVS